MQHYSKPSRATMAYGQSHLLTRLKTMNNTLKTELLEHIINTIKDQQLTDFEELHFHAFNEDYYIIGYYNAEQWLKQHDISAFEAISAVMEWEQNAFGELTLKPEDINSETIVNKYVYTFGENLLAEFDLDQDQESLLFDLTSAMQ